MLLYLFVAVVCVKLTTFLQLQTSFLALNCKPVLLLQSQWLWVIYISYVENHHLKVFLSQFSSVQFSRSVMSDSLRPLESQHARPPCPSPTPGVQSDSRPSSRWCHPATHLQTWCPIVTEWETWAAHAQSSKASVGGSLWRVTSKFTVTLST